MKIKTNTLKTILIIILAIMALISLLKGIQNGMTDPVDFLWSWFRDALDHRIYEGPQFPFTFWMIFPLGLLPEMTARVVWILCNLIFTVLLLYALRKTFFSTLSLQDFITLSLLMVAGGPWRTNLSNGQYTLCAVSFFMLGVYLSEKGKPVPAGLFLAMSLFKYQMIVPMAVWFFFKKRYKEIFFAVVFTGISFVLNWIWFGSINGILFYQLRRSAGLAEEGDVDIETLLGLGSYTILIFVIALIILMILAYTIKIDDALFLSVTMFVAWFAAYQRMYNFFPLIVPLGYELYRGIYKKDRISRIIFGLILALTMVYFFGLTVSDEYAGIVIRILYYPSMVALFVEVFRENRQRKVVSADGVQDEG